MNPKISIVLPAYKKRFLANSIQSILNQTYKNYERIIVNDCSPEDLDSICNSFVDDRIQYYKNSNNMGGKDLIKCWNHCIQYATGEYLILASDDDIYEEEFLETMVELSQKRPEVNLIRSRVQIIDSKGKVIKKENKLPEFITQEEYIYRRIQNGFNMCVPNFMFKLSTFIKEGGFYSLPSAWHSDEVTSIKMSRKGVLNTQNILFNFRMSGENISSITNPQTCYYKIEASYLFYNWINTFLIDIKANNGFQKYSYSEIQDKYIAFIHNIIYSTLRRATFGTIFNVFTNKRYKSVITYYLQTKIIFSKIKSCLYQQAIE